MAKSYTNLVALLADSPRFESQDHAPAKTAEEELGRIAHLTRQSLSFYRDSTSLASVNLKETSTESPT